MNTDDRNQMDHPAGEEPPSGSLNGLPPLEARPTIQQPATPRNMGTVGRDPDWETPRPAASVNQDDWITQDLPAPYYQPGIQMTPRRPRRAGPPSSRKPLLVAVSVVLVLALLAGTVYAVKRITSPQPTTNKKTLPAGCDPNTPCGVAYAYLDDYTGGNYKAMVAQTSAASQQKFSDPKITRGNYANGQDYIATRTANILNEAAIVQMSATPGKVSQQSATSASVPVLVTMQSSIVGQMNEHITIPLVSENGKWRVTWTPGLIFPQLDDANDPTYTRALHLFEEVGHRGTIYDSAGDVIAEDGANGTRTYPYGPVLAAVTGYVSVVTAQDLQNDKAHYYQQGDMVGHAGIEQWGEQYLRPGKGGTLGIYDLNADGTLSAQPVVTLANKPATNGDDIHTTINLADQQAAYNGLKLKSVGTGSGVFGVDPTTGKVLVMASYPACDPNDFAQGNAANINACINNPIHPLLNYALASPQPIGSVFKLVTLSAGISHNISSSQTFTCSGSYQVPGESTARIDDVPSGHGTLTPPQAIPVSCDVVFWKISVQLGNQDPNILPNEARAFGYGSALGVVGVPDGVESGGLVPDPQWLQSHENANWSPSDSANLGIGQGFFLATPAQVAMATAALGNGGTRYQPSLVQNIFAADGSTVMSFQPKQVGTLPLTADQLQTIQAAMLQVTQQSNATGYGLRTSLPVLIGSKSGTAQTSQPKPDSWFTLYAPASPLSGPTVTPQIALTGLIENSGNGEPYAGVALVQVLDAHFHK